MSKLKNLAQTDLSKINAFSLDSLATNQSVNVEHNLRLVNHLIDNIFEDRKGICDISSSQCSSLKIQPSDYSYDKRLKYWKAVLRDREKLKSEIYRKTKKSPYKDVVLCNNHATTIDDRDKQTIKRIFDYAERLDPERLCTRKINTLPAKCEPTTCQTIMEIEETLPKAEREKTTKLEICGLPKVTRQEILGKEDCTEKYPSKWLSSKHLERRIEQHRENIERVVEFYPDIENLQIVGKGLIKSPQGGLQHNSKIQLLLPEAKICEISSESKEDCEVLNRPCPQEEEPIPPKPIEYGFKINDQIYILENYDGKQNKSMEIEVNFNGHPFEVEMKKVLVLQNLGQKILNFKWLHCCYYKNNVALLKSMDNEFVFDNRPFRLCRGEIKEISVLYRPRKVALIKSKWQLKVDLGFFKTKTQGIILKLSGNCEPHAEYVKKLEELQSDVIGKSNMKMMRKLTHILGDLSPAAVPPSYYPCPYQRPLTELEIFENLNPGYKCERYHDLDTMKELYSRVKKPRDKLWNLKVETLKNAVCNLEDREKRVLYFNELSSLLMALRRASPLKSEIVYETRRTQTSLLCVRAMIGKFIEEWENLRDSLKDGFLKALEISNKNGSGDSNNRLSTSSNDTMKIDFLEKQLRNSKSFYDTLYLQTYSLLCNFLEDLVNVIESSEIY
ncbi:uncharacterized protein LOC133332589 [Musca vetustissima]|uniref:uncharacterized protein LOC133332589 n=1 Tax=Musca vetustissima TaxID=27455 RepID=UPI002AB5F488|nr:uncharacterized protein LOC133332589 [Musca vetustissima]